MSNKTSSMVELSSAEIATVGGGNSLAPGPNGSCTPDILLPPFIMPIQFPWDIQQQPPE